MKNKSFRILQAKDLEFKDKHGLSSSGKSPDPFLKRNHDASADDSDFQNIDETPINKGEKDFVVI